jgi:hypothetical protein
VPGAAKADTDSIETTAKVKMTVTVGQALKGRAGRGKISHTGDLLFLTRCLLMGATPRVVSIGFTVTTPSQGSSSNPNCAAALVATNRAMHRAILNLKYANIFATSCFGEFGAPPDWKKPKFTSKTNSELVEIGFLQLFSEALAGSSLFPSCLRPTFCHALAGLMNDYDLSGSPEISCG